MQWTAIWGWIWFQIQWIWHLTHTEKFWVAFSAIATLVAAAYTARMAQLTKRTLIATRDAIKESRAEFVDSAKSTERHHQETYRPILTLRHPAATATAIAAARQLVISGPRIDDKEDVAIFNIIGRIENIGLGPALVVRMHIRPEGRPIPQGTFELSPVKAGGTLENRTYQLLFYLAHNFNAEDAKRLPGGLWQIVLEYQDVFGNEFHTTHFKSAFMPWTSACKGRAPDRIPERAPWEGSPGN